MADEKSKGPHIHALDLEELIDQLQPSLDAVKATLKGLEAPFNFLVYPLLMAQALIELSEDDMETAKSNHSNMGELTILAYLAMRYRMRGSKPEEGETRGVSLAHIIKKARKTPEGGGLH